jgi:hypothetical protein
VFTVPPRPCAQVLAQLAGPVGQNFSDAVPHANPIERATSLLCICSRPYCDVGTAYLHHSHRFACSIYKPQVRANPIDASLVEATGALYEEASGSHPPHPFRATLANRSAGVHTI